MIVRSYFIPVCQALLVHALVIGAFTFNWESDSDRELMPQPQVVQAKVMTMADPIAARKKEQAKKKAAAKRKADAKKKADAKRKTDARKKADVKKKADAKRKADAKKKADAKRKADAKKKADSKRLADEKKLADDKRRQQEEAERLRQQQLAREEEQRERELAQSLEDELAQEQDEADAIAAQSYEGLIKLEIMQNWHIPLSARNGMLAKVSVFFVPTGEITNVTLIKRSGDEAFDRSVVQAVERTEKIGELKQLEPRVFDKYFRNVTITFRPEDLDR